MPVAWKSLTDCFMTQGVGGGKVCSRWSWVLACVLQAICLTAASATPDEDYLRGLQAYHRGDVASAMSILRVPADAGHAGSQRLLAFVLDRGDFAEEAARLYAKAALQGDPEAHGALANLYLTGRGIAKDEKQALTHFSKAADLGHSPSILALADAHLKGSMGLGAEPRDNARAVAALRRAADLGHLGAAEALAKAYREGGFGLAIDAAQAAQWRARSTELRQQGAASAPKGKS
jgi:TPR repeat protein